MPQIHCSIALKYCDIAAMPASMCPTKRHCTDCTEVQSLWLYHQSPPATSEQKSEDSYLLFDFPVLYRNAQQCNNASKCVAMVCTLSRIAWLKDWGLNASARSYWMDQHSDSSSCLPHPSLIWMWDMLLLTLIWGDKQLHGRKAQASMGHGVWPIESCQDTIYGISILVWHINFSQKDVTNSILTLCVLNPLCGRVGSWTKSSETLFLSPSLKHNIRYQIWELVLGRWMDLVESTGIPPPPVWDTTRHGAVMLSTCPCTTMHTA